MKIRVHTPGDDPTRLILMPESQAEIFQLRWLDGVCREHGLGASTSPDLPPESIVITIPRQKA